MCGIVGLYQPGQEIRPEQLRARVEAMRDSLKHRGPDDAGLWMEADGIVALAHRRLSILDVSAGGHQPMASRDGRYELVYNGEVYNYLDLRRQLESSGHQFHSTSDTEVLLAACCEWGLERALPLLNGMFALALWDKHTKKLALARDRYGKKPLYYGKIGKAWAFASELKALRILPDFAHQIDQTALGEYFRLGYVPAPYSIYESIRKLPAASYCWLDDPPKKYWRLPGTTRSGENSSLQELEIALLQSVKLRMVSDVPLGAFLSGGIDSSLVVAMMQEQSGNPIRTFTLGFPSATHDEAAKARKIAKHLGTDHLEHYVTAEEALEVVPQLPRFYDEPFADSSQIPTYLVCKLARRQVTVALSGDGGDEVFAGYNRYLFAPKVWNLIRLIPLPLRDLLSTLLNRLPVHLLAPLLGGRVAYPHEKISKLIGLLRCSDRLAVYQWLVSTGSPSRHLLKSPAALPAEPAVEGDFVDWMMIRDAQTYLPDDILVKVDRASMAVSLEARAPLLDPVVTESAWRLPRNEKIEGSQGKKILRKLLYKRVPEAFLTGPKTGFSLPLGDWLRSGLRDWAEDIFAEIRTSDYLYHQPIEQLWREHLSGHRDRSATLWTVLMFQAWLRDQQ